MADNENQPPTLKDLAKQAGLRARLTESQVEQLVNLLQRFVDQTLRRSGRRLGDEVSVREASRALADLEGAVRDAGLGDILSGVKDLFRQEFNLSLEDFRDTTNKTAAVSGFARDNLDALVDDRLDMAAKMVNRYVGDVRTAVLDTVVLGNPPDLEAAAEAVGETLFNHLKTELNTSLQAFQRITHFEAAEEAGMSKFLYVGPDDEVTRPFCEKHVGKIYTRDEIAAMDNGQGLPVEVYGGGYNCRHHWRPVSDELAKELEAEG